MSTADSPTSAASSSCPAARWAAASSYREHRGRAVLAGRDVHGDRLAEVADGGQRVARGPPRTGPPDQRGQPDRRGRAASRTASVNASAASSKRSRLASACPCTMQPMAAIGGSSNRAYRRRASPASCGRLLVPLEHEQAVRPAGGDLGAQQRLVGRLHGGPVQVDQRVVEPAGPRVRVGQPQDRGRPHLGVGDLEHPLGERLDDADRRGRPLLVVRGERGRPDLGDQGRHLDPGRPVGRRRRPGMRPRPRSTRRRAGVAGQYQCPAVEPAGGQCRGRVGKRARRTPARRPRLVGAQKPQHRLGVREQRVRLDRQRGRHPSRLAVAGSALREPAAPSGR